MAAVHLNNLLFLLFVALAIFFQILTRVATKSRRRPGETKRRSTSPSQMSRPISGDADETDEQRIRKFLEALGQPTTSKPPAPVAPRTDGPPPLDPSPVIKTAAKAYAIATQPISKSVEAKIDIATMLRSTSGLRDAIILREIFGPPRSLQPLDLVGSV